MGFSIFKKNRQNSQLLTNDKKLLRYPLVLYNKGFDDKYLIVNHNGIIYPPNMEGRNRKIFSKMREFAYFVFNNGFTIDLLEFNVQSDTLRRARVETCIGKSLRKFNTSEIEYYNYELKKIREQTGMQNTYVPTTEEMELYHIRFKQEFRSDVSPPLC